MIVIGIGFKNGADTIKRAVISVLNQKGLKRDIRLLLVNDNSRDSWKNELSEFLGDNRIIIQDVNLGRSYLVRNYINSYIRNNFSETTYIGRLDCDDELVDDTTLSTIENILINDKCDALILGNKLRQNGQIIHRVNIADKRLLDNNFLLNKLQKMSIGDPEGELPSCNTFIKTTVNIDYRPVLSAEDHWFTVDLLLQADKYNIVINEQILYAIYSLSGDLTKNNRQNRNYLTSRKELYHFVKEQYRLSREVIALSLLKKYENKDYQYLGEGFAGIVFHDNSFSYKVHIPKMIGSVEHYRQHCVGTLNEKKHLFQNSKHFFEIKEVVSIKNTYILISKYIPSERVDFFREDELISFLTECWRKKFVFIDIKESNFVRVDNTLKMIDIEIDSYTDNLFLNMIVRAFIRLKYCGCSPDFIFKLGRSAINQFDLPELAGVKAFCNKVFANIIFEESKMQFPEHISQTEDDSIETVEMKFNDSLNLKKIFYDELGNNRYLIDFQLFDIYINKLYFEPKRIRLSFKTINTSIPNVTLLIKTCPQESETIVPLTEHIIKQLSSPDIFFEKVIAVDKKKGNYLRQYTNTGDLKKLYHNINMLKNRGLIDRIIELPDEEIEKTNLEWFGFSTNITHTFNGIPVTPQLYAFDNCRTDYILQMDCDVIIGRYDYKHSFLKDMISEIEKNERVVSVGFNICQHPDKQFKPYAGFEDGGFVPEVRFCLISKKRLNKAKYLSNEIANGGFRFSWYRALEIRQKEIGLCSIRGGSPKSFYIHPQNYRKACPDVWFTILDRIEQKQIIEKQFNEFDLSGSFYDWCFPKRNEKMVIVSCVRNIEYSRFLRFWYSVISQTYTDWGMILIDDNSDNGLDFFIEGVIQTHQHQVTYIKNKMRQGIAANTYKAIHYFASNSESIIVIIDSDDALLGSDALQDIINRYDHMNADIIIGKMYRTDKLTAHYKYTPDFINPRVYGGNVWQHLRTFKKYFFDSLSIYDLKMKAADQETSLNKLSKQNQWIEHCVDYAYMIPIVEMCQNPLIIERFNYFHDRTTPNIFQIKRLKNEIIQHIISNAKKSKSDVIKGRKRFQPCTNKIEIDLTYDCNLKCIGCNRSCTQAPSKEQMSIEQIEFFITESIQLGKRWELINILGGEPTFHKDFIDIVHLILNCYVKAISPDTLIQITTNGTEPSIQKIKMLPDSPKIVIDKNSFKQSNKIEYFSPFNDAPTDNPEFKTADFSKGCWITSYCGIGLNLYGYYCCSVAGGIDRILGSDRAIKSLKQIDNEKLKEQLTTFCKYCGIYSDYDLNKGDFIPRCEKAPFKANIVSKTWNSLYENYSKSKLKNDKKYLISLTDIDRGLLLKSGSVFRSFCPVSFSAPFFGMKVHSDTIEGK